MAEYKAYISSYSFFPVKYAESSMDEKQVEGLCTEKTLEVFYALSC